jgi:hypothetical protein
MFSDDIQRQFSATLDFLKEVHSAIEDFKNYDGYDYYLHEEFNNIADDAHNCLGSLRRRASHLKTRASFLKETQKQQKHTNNIPKKQKQDLDNSSH